MEGTNPVEDMVESGQTVKSLFDSWKPRTWYQEIWWWIQYGIWNWVGYRGEVWRYLVRFWQRGKRGYATCDVWGFHGWHSDFMVGCLKELLDMAHGHPCEVKDLNEWKSILTQILWTFDTARNISDRNWLYLPPERRTEKDYTELKDFAKRCEASYNKTRLLAGTKHHVMTYAECERYERGWELLQKYYFGLWD